MDTVPYLLDTCRQYLIKKIALNLPDVPNLPVPTYLQASQFLGAEIM